MKKRWFLLALVLAAGSLSAQSTARVFGLNLFPTPVDVALGEAWRAAGLAPREASPMAVVPAGPPVAVQFRRVGVASWSTARGADAVVLEAGAVYVLVVRQNGSGELVKVPAAGGPGPRVLFVNGARTPAALLRLGSGTSADGLEPGWTGFVAAAPGKQTLTWSWPTMPPGTELYKADSPQPGRPGVIDLVNGHWYVALVASFHGQVTDLGGD